MYKAEDNIFFHGKQCDPKQSQNHQLDWTDFTKNCTVGNEAAGHTEVSINQAGKRNKVKMLGRYETMADWHIIRQCFGSAGTDSRRETQIKVQLFKDN